MILMSEKRFYISFITASRQIRIVDRETTFVAVVDVYDDKIQYFVDKLNEQQATITHLEKVYGENFAKKRLLEQDNLILRKENEALKKFIKDNFNEMMDSKMVIDDEPFEFNKNCAKPYEIRSISPNGVIRVGKKNSKVSWRMKDVREISEELPPFEDFNREEYQKIRNKFAPKFGGGDLIGRIIWNIYNGTFGEYI